MIVSRQYYINLRNAFENEIEAKIDKIKLLNQDERRLILHVIDVASYSEDSIKTTQNSFDLIQKLTSSAFAKIESRKSKKPSNFLVSLIKGIANRFFGRISSHMVLGKLKYAHIPLENMNDLDKID